MYLDDSVIDDIQGRLGDGRLPAGETEDSYYSRYEVDEAWIAGTGAPSRRFRIMDYRTGLSYYIAIEQAAGEKRRPGRPEGGEVSPGEDRPR